MCIHLYLDTKWSVSFFSMCCQRVGVFVWCLFTSFYVTFSGLKLAEDLGCILSVVAIRFASGHRHLQLLTRWRRLPLPAVAETWPPLHGTEHQAHSFAACHCTQALMQELNQLGTVTQAVMSHITGVEFSISLCSFYESVLQSSFMVR